MQLIGREKEISQLQSHYQSGKSEFIAIYGRRRVGKTFLVRNVFEDAFTFQMTGLANVTMAQQLGQFHSAMTTQAPFMAIESPNDWFTAFRLLIDFLQRTPDVGKKIIFLDELPWFDTPRSRFLSALEHFWNSWASARNDIMLIVCGSAASWMLNKLIHNRGGLHNRITGRIKLEPFTLAETEQFLQSRNGVFDRYQILLLYMVFGGIPFYLEGIQPGLSAMQNINALCFEANAPFRTEFDNLYASLFSTQSRHIDIVHALANKQKGLNRRDVVRYSGLPDAGSLTRILGELEASSFIRRYHSFGKSQRDSIYQLIDHYSLFYLQFIQYSSRDDDNYWMSLTHSPAYYAWAGFAFERVCLQHVQQIKYALGISGVQTSVSAWFSPDAQIDLLIDRKDQVINVCEMKFSIHPFSIDTKYATSLRNKLGSFREATGTKKSLFLTLLTTYGISDNQYKGMVQNDLTMDVLFQGS